MLPQGMFSVAVVTVLFPTLSRFAAVGNLPSFRATIDAGLRQIAFLLLPAGAVGAVLAQPIVRLLYERGAFTAANTVVVAECLAAFSGSCSTAGCSCSRAASTACSETGCRPRSPSARWR